MTRVRERHGLYACFASPPCKDYSTARRKDQPSKAPPLIPQTRAMLQALFDYWAIENVMGAKKHMSDHAVQLDGALFGLEVSRARLIESNFEVIMDESVTGPAETLRMRTCLGKRRRWKRVDRWGRIDSWRHAVRATSLQCKGWSHTSVQRSNAPEQWAWMWAT